MTYFSSENPVSMEQLRHDYIMHVIAMCGGNKTKATLILGLSYRTITSYLEIRGIKIGPGDFNHAIICHECKKETKVLNYVKKYCSTSCYDSAMNKRRRKERRLYKK